MVVVDNVGFPGLGTFSARVLFHEGRYAGYWHGADHGGHLFGTIERTKPKETKPKEAKPNEKKPAETKPAAKKDANAKPKESQSASAQPQAEANADTAAVAATPPEEMATDAAKLLSLQRPSRPRRRKILRSKSSRRPLPGRLFRFAKSKPPGPPPASRACWLVPVLRAKIPLPGQSPHRRSAPGLAS